MGVQIVFLGFISGKTSRCNRAATRRPTSPRSAPGPAHLEAEDRAGPGHRTGPDQARPERAESLFQLAAVRLCGLPVRRLPKDQLLYERRNGNFVLQVTGHPEFGVPFGQDRLVPIFLATLAVRQKTQVISFRSAAEMLDSFGMHRGGKEYRRLVAAFERIFGATIFFGTDTLTGQAKVVQRSRFNFMSEAKIWYSRTPDRSTEFKNVIVLSDDFYQEVIAHPVPNDLEAVKVPGRLAGGSRPLYVAFVPLLQGQGT